MKYLILIASVASFTLLANQVDLSLLKSAKITPVETFKKQQKTVTLNGTTYVKSVAAKNNKRSSKVAKQRVSVDLPTVISGEVLYSEDGFFEYLVTGEVIVKLTGAVDFTELNNRHNLSIKQAYKNYYVLKGQANDNLINVVNDLIAMPNVASATIDIVDKNINHF